MATEKQVNSVKVRMYRHGFGDCFLLSFCRGKTRVFSMLIDCGIKHNTKSDDVPIEDVIKDLLGTLKPVGGGKPVIDVLVATHEHWDHISFFHPTKSPNFFSQFEIRQVWLAWTENPEDEEALRINSRLRQGAAALKNAARKLKNTLPKKKPQSKGMYVGEQAEADAREQFNLSLEDVLGFYGVTAITETSVTALRKTTESGIKYKDKNATSVETAVAMENIVELGKKGNGIKYFSPGTQVDRAWVPPGVNVFVLGPPKNALINKSNPTRGHGHENYLGIDHSGLTSFIDGALQMDAEQTGKLQVDHSKPFGNGVGISAEAAKTKSYFQQFYFDADQHRMIENNWLDIAGQFALQLDGAINNTSLVLAIELEESGKVLLFPGDAQVGSWLSWHQHEWKVKRDSKTKTITATDLLNNTVLYKVSHHGSHNATVKDQGLELMTHPELVAMMPEKEKCYNGIPHPPLIKRLKQMCKGRVLVSADVNFPPESLETDAPKELSPAEWEEFKANLVVDKLYIEYTIK